MPVLHRTTVTATPRHPQRLRVTHSTVAQARPLRAGTRWLVVAVSYQDDTNTWVAVPGGWLSNAVLGPITLEPCAAEKFWFTLPAHDPKASLFAYENDGTPHQEVQVWYGERLIAWGHADSPSWNDSTVTVNCTGIIGVATDRRSVGPAQRLNMLENGNIYDDGQPSLSSWIPNVYGSEPGSWYPEGADTHSTAIAHPQLWGRGAVEIVDHSDEFPDDDKLVTVAQDMRYNANHKAWTVRLRARVMVTEFTAPNTHKAALVLLRLPLGYTSPWEDAVDVAHSSPALDETHPLNEVVDHSVSLEVPWDGNDWIIQARLEGCKGTVVITDVWEDYTDSLRLSGDQAFIFLALVDHLTGNRQAPWLYSRVHPDYPWVHWGYGKSDLHIDVDAPNTGVERYRDYQFEQRPAGGSSMNEFSAYDDGLEWSMAYAWNKRICRAHHPKKGVYRRDCRLTSIHGRGNVVSWEATWQGQQFATSVTVNPVDGGWREGSALDPDVADGLTLEEVRSAPPDADRDALDAVAAQRLNATKKPTSITMHIDFRFWSTRYLHEGDRVEVDLRGGAQTITGRYWLRTMTITAGSPTIEVQAIPWPYNR